MAVCPELCPDPRREREVPQLLDLPAWGLGGEPLGALGGRAGPILTLPLVWTQLGGQWAMCFQC